MFMGTSRCSSSRSTSFFTSRPDRTASFSATVASKTSRAAHTSPFRIRTCAQATHDSVIDRFAGGVSSRCITKSCGALLPQEGVVEGLDVEIISGLRTIPMM